jgi:hypothetical protein
MASSAIERLRESTKRAREKTSKVEQGIIRKATISLTGAALGYGRQRNMPVAIAGVPIKLVIGAVGTVGELMTKGATQRFFGAAGDAALAVYAHEAMQEGSFVAGAEEVSGDEL